MAKSDNTNEVGLHVFERAGLGKAPFRFIGAQEVFFQATPDAPRQCGGSCDFCGTGIVTFCFIRSADGREFKVGSDCLRKTGDAGLIKSFTTSPDQRRKAADARQAKRVRVTAEWDALWADPATEATLAPLTHTWKRWNNTMGTEPLVTHFHTLWKMCGAAGEARLLKALKVRLAKERT
jgi:hypothetical protein